MSLAGSNPIADEDVALQERLQQLKFCGRGLAHPREANLVSIDKLLAGQVFYTFGITSVAEAAASGRLTREGILAMVAAITGCSADPDHTTGPSYISPRACLLGLRQAARTMRRIRDRGGTVVFGAGHSGSMITCYNRLADYFRDAGCTIATPAAGATVAPDWYLDYIGTCAVVTDTCGIHHTHLATGMQAMLDGMPRPPDLVIADHGFAGEAINRGIACVAPMDTNDPALAVARHLGARFDLVPMNDNRPNFVTIELADIYIGLIEAAWRPFPGERT